MKRRGATFALILFVIFLGLPVFATKAESKSLETDYPVRITAPSIALSSPIQGVGVNEKGEMDVPPGHTNNVGWYKHGTPPGASGTAVLDAHVFAAFKSLDKLKEGESIYIYMKSGKRLRYIITKTHTYKLSEISPHALFAPTKSKALNLITCAGSLTQDRSTYSHRLLVSAKLVERVAMR